MGLRSQPQQVDHHHLAVVIPAIGEKAEFRRPAVRQKRSIFGEPTPIHAIKDLVSQKTNFGMLLEVLPASKNSAKQDRRLDGRDFGITHALASVDIGKVIEETSMGGHLLPQETQGGESPFPHVVRRNESALFSNAQSGQAKSRSGNTADRGGTISLDVASVLNQSSLRACLLPEILKVQFFQFIQKLIVFLGQGGRTGRDVRSDLIILEIHQ